MDTPPVTPSRAPRRAASVRRPVERKATPTRKTSRRQATPWDSDAELVAAILSGSSQHFDLLYEAHFPRVYRFALKRLRDQSEAEDVTQEVFVVVFRSLPSYRGDSSLLTWIFGITRNKVNRRFRGVRPPHEPIDGIATELEGQEPPTDETVDARRLLAECERVIERRLTPLQRRIFHLTYLRRQSIRSIAGALGKSEDAVKANLYRIRRAIVQAAPGLDQSLRT